jgi:hypothetical protein
MYMHSTPNAHTFFVREPTKETSADREDPRFPLFTGVSFLLFLRC